ncbi:hypothetical protein DL96DRAFT_669428 [Flagelloscypha sp. PMI_526]|nr:hypothetical protein DL96DRAFT_669428 [Flagelloscypha sp. PMI_526]
MSSTEPCRSFAEGSCSEGEQCPFSHLENTICSFFQQSSCQAGDSCAFVHDISSMSQDTVSGDDSQAREPGSENDAFSNASTPISAEKGGETVAINDQDVAPNVPPPGLESSFHAPPVSKSLSSDAPVFEPRSRLPAMMGPDVELPERKLDPNAKAFEPTVSLPASRTHSEQVTQPIEQHVEDEYSLQDPEASAVDVEELPTTSVPAIEDNVPPVPSLPPQDMLNGWSEWNDSLTNKRAESDAPKPTFDIAEHARFLYSKLPPCPYFYSWGRCPLAYSCSFSHLATASNNAAQNAPPNIPIPVSFPQPWLIPTMLPHQGFHAPTFAHSQPHPFSSVGYQTYPPSNASIPPPEHSSFSADAATASYAFQTA